MPKFNKQLVDQLIKECNRSANHTLDHLIRIFYQELVNYCFEAPSCKDRAA